METPGADHVHISDLPVDVLLEVFCRLPAVDLAHSVSAVCTSWRDLAEEHAAWQDRCVQVAPRKHRPLSAAERRVLRRAPALRALSVSLRRAQDLAEPLGALLPRCGRLRELRLQLPRLLASTAEDVARHWPRLRHLRVEAVGLEEGSLDALAGLGELRELRLATLQPGAAVWAALCRGLQRGLPALRALRVDARCHDDDLEEAQRAVLQAADRVQHLRLDALVPAHTDLLAAVGQCHRLQSLHIEDCSALTDQGLLCLAGLRLQSLTLSRAQSVSTAALARFLQQADLSQLQLLDLGGCLALNDRLLRLLASRCSSPPRLAAHDCPHVSAHALLRLHGTPAPDDDCSRENASSCATSADTTHLPVAPPARQLGVF